MKDVNFTAFDFETADAGHSRACQIGVVVVRDNKIVKEYESLIKPPEETVWNYRNTEIHGISSKQVSDAPSFAEVWEEIKSFFEGQTVVAHKMTFDREVLRKELEQNNIPLPDISNYVCTCELHGKMKLLDTCKLYGIELTNHHDGLCDARACAEIYIAYQEKGDSIPIPVIKKNTSPKPTNRRSPLSGDILVKDLSKANPNSPFYDKKVVITGTFPISRTLIGETVKKMGADIDKSISKNTQIVLMGKDAGPKKKEKIELFQNQGIDIVVYDELETMSLIEKYL